MSPAVQLESGELWKTSEPNTYGARVPGKSSQNASSDVGVGVRGGGSRRRVVVDSRGFYGGRRPT
jgi:hypothetical protein